MSAVKSSVAVMIRPPRIRSGMSRHGALFDALRAPSRQLPPPILVRLGPPVAEELPGAPDLLDHVEVHLRDDELVFVFAALRQEIAARIDEIARAVELPHVPRRLDADAIDATHEVAVGHGMGRLLELPEILRESFHCRG